jgi:hypothetical protein
VADAGYAQPPHNARSPFRAGCASGRRRCGLLEVPVEAIDKSTHLVVNLACFLRTTLRPPGPPRVVQVEGQNRRWLTHLANLHKQHIEEGLCCDRIAPSCMGDRREASRLQGQKGCPLDTLRGPVRSLCCETHPPAVPETKGPSSTFRPSNASGRLGRLSGLWSERSCSPGARAHAQRIGNQCVPIEC